MISVDSDGFEDEDWVYACNWILLTRNDSIVAQLNLMNYRATQLDAKEDLPFWRDDYASIFRIMDKPPWWPRWLGGASE